MQRKKPVSAKDKADKKRQNKNDVDAPTGKKFKVESFLKINFDPKTMVPYVALPPM